MTRRYWLTIWTTNAHISPGSLTHWLYRIEDLKKVFSSVSFHHIYREKNQIADDLSKQGLMAKQGVIFYQFHNEGLQAEGSISIIWEGLGLVSFWYFLASFAWWTDNGIFLQCCSYSFCISCMTAFCVRRYDSFFLFWVIHLYKMKKQLKHMMWKWAPFLSGI